MIFTRKDGRHVVKWKDEATGAWRQRSFRELKDAEEFEREVNPATEDEQRLTVEECVLLYIRNHQLSRDRRKLYTQLVVGGKKPGCAEAIAGKFVDELNRRDLETVRDAARTPGCSAKSVNIYVSMLKTTFRYAAEQDLLATVPWEKYKPLPQGKAGSRKAKPEDVLHIVKALPEWARWACDVAINLCLRPGQAELGDLKWDAFDWKAGCVSIYMGKVKRVKIVYPAPAFLDRAKRRMEAQGGSRVVVGPRGGTAYRSSFSRAWRTAAKKLGLKGVVPYAMRHLAASQLLSRGVSIATVAEMLGHANPATTASFYVHASRQEQKAASALLPDLHQNGADGAD